MNNDAIPLLKINKDTPKEEPTESIEDVFKGCIIDLNVKVPSPNILLSIGQDWEGNPIPICTEGEFSCIVAPSKTKKSYFKSLLAASFMGGNSNTFTPHITGHRKNETYILDIDTEQGRFYAQKTFQRTSYIAGSDYKNYVPIYTRHLSAAKRVELIEYLFTKSKYAGKIQLCFIDGVADLVENSNDIVLSTKIAADLLRWTELYKIHICTIMHKTFGGVEKATGHLGSSIMKKVETIIYIDPITDNKGVVTHHNTVRIRCGLTRGRQFDNFYMSVNSQGLPYTHEADAMIVHDVGNPAKDLFTAPPGTRAKRTLKSDTIKPVKEDDDKESVPF